jgi:hypothetical protein
MLGDTMTHALEPWREMIDVITFPPGASAATSPAHLLADLTSTTAAEAPAGDLVACYEACLAAVETPPAWNDTRYLRMVFRQLVLDAPRLPHEWTSGVLARLAGRIEADEALSRLAARAAREY